MVPGNRGTQPAAAMEQLLRQGSGSVLGEGGVELFIAATSRQDRRRSVPSAFGPGL
jgi:hypothetical protein